MMMKVCMYMYVCMCMCICVCACMCICVNVYMYVCSVTSSLIQVDCKKFETAYVGQWLDVYAFVAMLLSDWPYVI